MKKLAIAIAVVGACALLGPMAYAQDKPLQVVMVDVEGGSAALYVTPEGQSLLVDTGWPAGFGSRRRAPGAAAPSKPASSEMSSADRIVAAAHKLGLTKIDYLLITHYHVDHVGGLSELVKKIPVGVIMDHGPNREVFVPTAAHPTPSAAAPQVAYPKYVAIADQHHRRIIKAGDTLQIGHLRLDFVSSDGQVIPKPLMPNLSATPYCNTVKPMAQDGGAENARSVGFVATYGKARILALGDASWNQELKMVCPVDLIGPVDLFVVTQHGSALSNTPSLIADAAPRVALMGNGSRKGGDKVVFETLAAAPSKPSIWQAHETTKDPESNRPVEYIANVAGPIDYGYSLDASVYPDGEIKVLNPRDNFVETYVAPK